MQNNSKILRNVIADHEFSISRVLSAVSRFTQHRLMHKNKITSGNYINCKSFFQKVKNIEKSQSITKKTYSANV